MLMHSEQPERRDLILQAVMDLLASRGPDGLTLKEVAKKAKVSTSLIGYHYGTKSRLFKAALDWVLEQVAEMEAGLAKENASPVDRLASFFLLQEKLLIERTELLTGWFSFVILGRSDPWVAARVQENYVDRVETFRAFLKDMMSRSLIRPDMRPSLTAEDLVASAEGMALLWLNRVDPKGIAAHRRRAVRRWQKTLGLKQK